MNPGEEWESDKLAPARGLLIGCATILAFWVVLLRLLNVI
jgi:hypothetical protein